MKTAHSRPGHDPAAGRLVQGEDEARHRRGETTGGVRRDPRCRPLEEVESYYETAGTVRAKAVSVIAARTMGAVLSVKVKEGDRVKAGQELLCSTTGTWRRRWPQRKRVQGGVKALDEARQQRSLADVTYRRYKNLFDEKVISRQEMDQVETQKKVADLGYERTEETVKRAAAQLEEARINRASRGSRRPTRG